MVIWISNVIATCIPFVSNGVTLTVLRTEVRISKDLSVSGQVSPAPPLLILESSVSGWPAVVIGIAGLSRTSLVVGPGRPPQQAYHYSTFVTSSISSGILLPINPYSATYPRHAWPSNKRILPLKSAKFCSPCFSPLTGSHMIRCRVGVEMFRSQPTASHWDRTKKISVGV